MITVNRNQSAIFGTIDGVKYKNVPFTKENYEELQKVAKEANSAATKSDADTYVALFHDVADTLRGDKTEAKKEVKLGLGGVTVVEQEGKPYLFNGKTYSRFYIPQEIFDRIQESQSKEIDATPFFKFFLLASQGEVMTQDKLNRLSKYISKTWIDQEQVEEYLAKGLTRADAEKAATVTQVAITQEGLLVTYKASRLIGEGNILFNNTEDVEHEEEDEDYWDDEDLDQDDLDEIQPTVLTDEDLGQSDGSPAEVDITEFIYQPKRNPKGHFYKRGSDDYIAEYNRQLDAFKAERTPETQVVTKIEKVVNKKTVQEKVPAVKKYAEDYLFIPAMQGYGGDAFYCGEELGHNIKVGKRHYLPSWSQVDTNDFTSARPGLHVGGLDYIENYRFDDKCIIHNIFVNPRHIGAVVEVEGGDGAMRVKEYFVHSSFIGPNRGLYHSSTYAAQSNEEWENALKSALETVEQAEARIAEIKKQAEKAQKLVDASFIL